MTDLYTTKDVQKTREKLLDEQNGLDPITGEKIPQGQAVLDHDHDTQYVRAVLHRQSNAALGKIENLYVRYLKWWYKGSLVDFLRGCVSYLETEHPKDFVHPKWLNKVQTEFNKLSEGQKGKFLSLFDLPDGKNGAERKKLFQSILKSKQYTFEEIMKKLKEVK